MTYSRLAYSLQINIVYFSLEAVNMVEKFVGNKIRELRKGAALTQEDLAFKSGLDRTYIASVEAGHRNISIKNLDKITQALNCTLSGLFFDYEREKDHE